MGGGGFSFIPPPHYNPLLPRSRLVKTYEQELELGSIDLTDLVLLPFAQKLLPSTTVEFTLHTLSYLVCNK